MPMKHCRLHLLTIAGLAITSQAMASGFGIFTQSATGLAKANSAVAHHDESSALFFNPALMSKIPDTQVEAEITLLAPKRSFNSSVTGTSADAEDQIFFPSTFYLTHTLSDTFSTGLAVYNPFGLASDWGPIREGRYMLWILSANQLPLLQTANIQTTCIFWH